MNILNFKKECWRDYPKSPSESSAFYSIYKIDGINFVTMYYRKENADLDAKIHHGRVVRYRRLIRDLGNGKTYFFHNFYLS